MPPINEDAYRPQSMPTGPRNVLRSNDSASLWNCTLSPGWSEEENEIFRKALMKFGIGNWAKIIESECLPGKTNAQMNLQLQRMLGQQSTAEFGGLHIDPLVIGEKNAKIQGPHIKRKNNCIVNTGGRPLREEIKARIAKNKELYEEPEEVWSKIELPKPQDKIFNNTLLNTINKTVLNAKKEELRRLQEELRRVQEEISLLKSNNVKEDELLSNMTLFSIEESEDLELPLVKKKSEVSVTRKKATNNDNSYHPTKHLSKTSFLQHRNDSLPKFSV
ncbi:1311_t:CDS:2 [Ambispora gerdemannii]|uniref:1311_t:CDS:1 n=1 Tax=Ambispora gerdemannii TaxID=144530 RepID=A0A9N9BTE9_9GLOM|nr:1311_t:CDS:2 [Ambispora gerdemannii]